MGLTTSEIAANTIPCCCDNGPDPIEPGYSPEPKPDDEPSQQSDGSIFDGNDPINDDPICKIKNKINNAYNILIMHLEILNEV